MPADKRPLKVFLCHYALQGTPTRTVTPVPQGDDMRELYARLTTLAPGASAGEDGVDVWLDKEKLLPGQDWELEIRKAVGKTIDV